MADITIIRGDSYALRRPLYTYTLVDDLGQPFNLAGCKVRTTFKTEKTPVDTDPSDDFAVIKHDLTVALDGTPTSQGLVLEGPASAGVVRDHFNSNETKMFAPNVTLISDLQLTDANGEIFTWIWSDGVKAIDAVTNRDN